MIRMRQRHEASGEYAPVTNLLWRHACERVPRRSRRQLHADAALDRLALAHRGAGDRPVLEVVARGEQLLLAAGQARLGGAHFREDGLEILFVDRQITGGRRPSRPLGGLHRVSARDDSHHHEPHRQRARCPPSTHHTVLHPTQRWYPADGALTSRGAVACRRSSSVLGWSGRRHGCI